MRAARLRTAVVVAMVVLGAIAGAAAVKSRSDYGTFAFWALPNRIDYCERRFYESAGDVHATPESLTAKVAGPVEWQQVGRTLVGRDIFAPVQRGLGRSTCTMDLYIHISGDRYRHYGISGGP